MAEQHGVSGDRERVIDSVSEVKAEAVSLQLNVSARYIVVGKITGNRYEWTHGGSVVSVDSLDASFLLEKKQGRSCCAGTPGQHIFSLV